MGQLDRDLEKCSRIWIIVVVGMLMVVIMVVGTVVVMSVDFICAIGERCNG